MFTLEDDAFCDLVSRTGRIETISLLNSGSLSNKGLMSIQNCHQLKILNLSHNLKITDTFGPLAFRKCVLLTHLTLADCANIGDRTLKVIGLIVAVISEPNSKYQVT